MRGSGKTPGLNRSTFGIDWSGKPGSNRRHPPWQGGALPLSYSRSGRRRIAEEARGVKTPRGTLADGAPAVLADAHGRAAELPFGGARLAERAARVGARRSGRAGRCACGRRTGGMVARALLRSSKSDLSSGKSAGAAGRVVAEADRVALVEPVGADQVAHARAGRRRRSRSPSSRRGRACPVDGAAAAGGAARQPRRRAWRADCGGASRLGRSAPAPAATPWSMM